MMIVLDCLLFANISPSVARMSGLGALVIALHVLVLAGAGTALRVRSGLRAWTIACFSVSAGHIILVIITPWFFPLLILTTAYVILGVICVLTLREPELMNNTKSVTQATEEPHMAEDSQVEDEGSSTAETAAHQSFSWGRFCLAGLTFFLVLWGGWALFLKFYLAEQSRRMSFYRQGTNGVRKIAQGAASWFEAEHIDPNGNPLPQAFPCADQGWICLPQQKLCQDGKPGFSEKIMRQDSSHRCFQALQFAIERRSHLRFCYRATGKGTNSRFTVRAEGSLSCRGKKYIYSRQGSVDPKTKKPQISPSRNETAELK